MFTKNEVVKVSIKSRSVVSGYVGVVASNAYGNEVKVVVNMNGYDVTGYVLARHLTRVKDEVVEDQDPTDILCRIVSFTSPVAFTHHVEYHSRPTTVKAGEIVAGYVSDQWVEDGIELLNVVYHGTFKVIPRSWVVMVWEKLTKDEE